MFTANWFDAAAIDLWKKTLRDHKGKPGLRYLEVGVFEGASLIWMVRNILTHKTARAIGVDKFADQSLRRACVSNLRKTGTLKKTRLIRGLSRDVLRELPDSSFDIIYIDGAHDMKSVLLDAVNCWYLLKNDGILIFDDYRMAAGEFPFEMRPQHAIDFFLTAFRYELELVHQQRRVVVRKRTNALPNLQRSRVGPYLINWYAREVVGPEGYEKLTPAQFRALGGIFKTLQMGQVDLNLELEVWTKPATRALLKRLALTKEDFLVAQMRPS